MNDNGGIVLHGDVDDEDEDENENDEEGGRRRRDCNDKTFNRMWQTLTGPLLLCACDRFVDMKINMKKKIDVVVFCFVLFF